MGISSPVSDTNPFPTSKNNKRGKILTLLLVAEDAEDGKWQAAAYEQFMRENSFEDSVYDKSA